MNKLQEYQRMLDKMHYYDADLLDIKFNHMLDEICLYIQETTNTCWELKLEGIGHVMYQTDIELENVEGNPMRDDAYSTFEDIESKFQFRHFHEGQELILTEYDDTSFQLYFFYSTPLYLSIVFRKISLKLDFIQNLDLYKVDNSFDEYGHKIKENKHG